MSTIADVGTTGEKELVTSQRTDSPLSCVSNTLEKLATKTFHAQPQNLLATAAVDWYYSLRVYLQVEQWQREDAAMTIADWGRKVGRLRSCTSRYAACITVPSAFYQMQVFISLQHSEVHERSAVICPAFGQCKGSSYPNYKTDPLA